MHRDYDVAVVGGGLVGAAIAWGLGRRGKTVAVLDEGDIAKRASRANFALVWVQSKGLGLPAYTGWTMRASQTWAGFAAELKEQTGLDVCLQQTGGFHLTLRRGRVRAARPARQAHAQPAGRRRLQDGDVDRVRGRRRCCRRSARRSSGGSFCPLDGHVNSLRPFRAFHTGFAHSASTICRSKPSRRLPATAANSG